MRVDDHAALELALERVRVRADPARREQVKWMLQKGGWRDAAEFCAYHCQVEALRLKPWESPPCYASVASKTVAGGLLRRMLAAKISRWHPDPEAALAAAERFTTAHP